LRRLFVLLSFLFTASYCFAQHPSGHAFILTGWVFDQQGNPIPYASVGLLERHLGTSTNMAGGFMVRVKGDSLIYTDTLVISCLGYKSFKKALNQVRDTLVVTLRKHTYELDEVIITNRTAAEVVAEMFKMKKKNYPRRKFAVSAFYRGLIRNDSTYVMMTEAVLNITDKGYHKLGDTKFYLNELKYLDEREFDSLDVHYDSLIEMNEAYRLWRLDYMNWSFDRTAIFGRLASLEYRLDSITYFDNQPVYCISVLNGSSWFYNQLFIRMDNFALLEARRGVYLESYVKKNKRLFSPGHAVDDRHSMVEVVQYKPYQGKWYLSYASLTESLVGGDKQKSKRLANEIAREKGSTELNYTGIKYNGRILDPAKNNYFRQIELLITHIFSKSAKIKKGQLMDKKQYIYRYPVPYHNQFWLNYRQLQLNPNLKRAKQHLQVAEILNRTGN